VYGYTRLLDHDDDDDDDDDDDVGDDDEDDDDDDVDGDDDDDDDSDGDDDNDDDDGGDDDDDDDGGDDEHDDLLKLCSVSCFVSAFRTQNPCTYAISGADATALKRDKSVNSLKSRYTSVLCGMSKFSLAIRCCHLTTSALSNV
jgi:hypothetical protein